MANVPSLSVVRDQAKPKKLGRYELEECLGADGGRETYRARVRGLAGFDRVFTVKCLRRRPGVTISRTDPILLVAKRSTSVTDPRVARVLDADVIDGAAVVVTEFVQGLDLDRFREWAQVSGELATGNEPAAEKWQRYVAYLGAEIAGALAAMHALAPPLVHGGLSPRNVIVTTRGGIKILDVGLGVAVQRGGDVPSPRSLAYAPPGPPGAEPTAASDVRALGAMLFELATGEPLQPGVTSAAARRMLEPNWLAVAEFIASMLAEDPALRPRATRVAEVLAGRWAGTPETAMATEMASLVRNFSAFVADAGPAGVAPAPGVEPTANDPILSSPSGVLTMAPPMPAASSSSFLAVSDQATRVSPDGNYANALFQSLAGDGSAPGAAAEPPAPPAPPLAHGPASPAPGRGPTMRSFSAIKPAEILAARPLEPRASTPPRQAALPVLATGPLSRDAAMPALPPPSPVRPPFTATVHQSRGPAAPASRATVMYSPPTPPPPAPAVVSPPPPVPEPVVDEFSDAGPAEPMLEAADWGARALAALGTQAGIQIALVTGEPAAEDLGATQLAPPPVSDPAIEEAFALAPLPLPPNSWNAPQPVSDGIRMSPIQPPAWNAPQPASSARLSPLQAPVLTSPARTELLEEELLEDEPTPLLVQTSVDPQAEAEAYGADTEMMEPPAPETEPQSPEAEPEQIQPSELEAMAFSAEAEAGFESEPAPVRIPQAMSTAEPRPSRGARARSAMRPREDSVTDESGDESWRPAPSRAKQIAVVLLAAAGLGAGAAALTLGPFGNKRAAVPQALPGARTKKVAAAKPAAETAKADKPEADGKVEAKPAGKAQAKPETKTAAAAGKPAPAVPAGKAVTAKTPSESPVAGKERPVLAAAPAAPDFPSKAKPLAPAKTPDSPASKPAPEASVPVRATAPGTPVRVHVSSQPSGARVWINGEERGETPCTVESKAGSARVALVHAGFLTSQATVEVGEGSKIDETLKPVEPPMTGEARFRAECQTPGKLPIVVDGKETGILCPFSKMRVEPGTHTIGLLIPATGKIHQKEVTLPPGVRSVVFAD